MVSVAGPAGPANGDNGRVCGVRHVGLSHLIVCEVESTVPVKARFQLVPPSSRRAAAFNAEPSFGAPVGHFTWVCL